MLAHQWHHHSGIPVVLLHGLLGSREDWQRVLIALQKFPQIRPLVIDLPLHHQSQHCQCDDFSQARTLLDQTFRQLIAQPFYLVGYSLGGRLALDYLFHQANPNLQGVILEGANVGLTTEWERQARWQNDQHWANRFRHEPMTKVLNDWYQQPVFADLSTNDRANLIEARQQNKGENIAQMLEATSLAKQPNYAEDCKNFCKIDRLQGKKMCFFIGEQDHKFRQMVQQYQLPYQLISQAGHNAHLANPIQFSQKLAKFILEENEWH